MSDAEQLYQSIGEGLKNAEASAMFGKPCLKIEGKAFAAFFEEAMVFKLTGETHAQALKLSGSKLWDPSGKGRAMKEWVQVPYEHHDQWSHLAESALNYVFSQIK